jgi:hypothetical protein
MVFAVVVSARTVSADDAGSRWARKGNPFVNPSSPVLLTGYRVWDDLGRNALFREGGVAQTAEASPKSWDISHRHGVTRVRYLQIRG